MHRIMLKSKIHRATVTGLDLEYEGSIKVDAQLLEAADILPGEQVQVLNLNNGARFVTYAILGRHGSGEIRLNGPAARMAVKGDIVIIITYCSANEAEIKTLKPKVIQVDARNRIQGKRKGGKKS